MLDCLLYEIIDKRMKISINTLLYGFINKITSPKLSKNVIEKNISPNVKNSLWFFREYSSHITLAQNRLNPTMPYLVNRSRCWL